MKYKNKSGQAGSKRSSISKSSSLVGAAAVVALVSVGAANGQQSEPAPSIEEVVVTGSMIRRDGYETPAPALVLGEEALNQMPVTQIAEVVERMPAVEGSQNSRNNASKSDGTSGTNLLNLRGLGANRTLVLLDGKQVGFLGKCSTI
jgi:iron complex outermembrane receptor protein